MTLVTPCTHNSPGNTTSPELIRLWDGRDHCAACVEAACPGLVAFARGRDCLEDSIPYDRAGGMRVLWRIVGLFYGVLALAGVGIVATLDRITALILLGSMAVGIVIMPLRLLRPVFTAKRVLPTVRVRDGLVEVFRPDHAEGKRPVAAFQLEDAHWRLGKLQEDSGCRGGAAIVPDQRVVLLQRPRTWSGVTPPSEFTAVGSTDEMVRIWEGFLKIAGVPEGKR